MTIVLFLFILLVVVIWLGVFAYTNDFSVKTERKVLTKISNVLVVFPHADDEALNLGGFISRLSKDKKRITWILLTKGGKGNIEGTFDENLKNIRASEAKKASKIYQIEDIIQKDYPDGGVEEHRGELIRDLNKAIDEIKPDLVVTYDLAGYYGHPDHIVTSEVITAIVKGRNNIRLWYVSHPQRILDRLTLPEHMAKDESFKQSRVYPTHKVWVGVRGVIKKVRAVYSYKSQRNSYTGSFPIKFVPLWFYVSLTLFEYYHEAQ